MCDIFAVVALDCFGLGTAGAIVQSLLGDGTIV